MNRQDEFKDFTVADFVWDEDFRNWVLSPDSESDSFWQGWLLENPEKKPVAYEARQIISSLRIKEPELSEEAISVEIQNILSTIEEREARPLKKAGVLAFMQDKRWQLGMVASVIIIVALGLIRYNLKSDKAANTYQDLVHSSKEHLTETVNKSALAQNVLLPDGSKIVLEKGSKISYSALFNQAAERKLYLSGTASFEVAKNPAKPFLVYTNGLITKVLGTKFIIKSNDLGQKVSVEVLSGIVSVYSYIDTKPNGESGGKKLNTLILTANQKANYSSEDKTLMATLVPNPLVVSSQTMDFKFKNAPIDSVFSTIGKAYGINIIYDDKSLAKRTFTATLTTETMYEKLDIICKTINAGYEVIDGKIIVYSNNSTK